MELPLTPSAPPRPAPRRSSGAFAGGGYKGPYGPCASLRATAYGTPLGRALLRAGDAYATSLLTGRRRWDEPPYGPEAEALTGRASLRDGPLITAPRLRDERLHGPEALTGRASLRTVLRWDEPPLAEALTDLLTLTGRVPHGASLRRRLRDERPYGPEALTGPASLPDHPLLRDV